ncbi:hypothetical protein HNY73_003063 [Argiope bruennichi]|uniref:Uncharacterized protein n=1 Tax=Argiope bruennichi TaxID=94029 RepID=A0A8T0FVQ0_ARGBR|nr:hypothetical protein HNY73_003063 [Argiope bruennichi]
MTGNTKNQTNRTTTILEDQGAVELPTAKSLVKEMVETIIDTGAEDYIKSAMEIMGEVHKYIDGLLKVFLKNTERP